MWYGDKKIAKDMTKEQLENKFEFGLTYLNIGTSIMTGNYFKHKDLAKRKDPQWPIFMNLFCSAYSSNFELFSVQHDQE